MPDLHDLYDAAHDFPRRDGAPRLSYVIASTPRSGSTHLAACLWRAGDLGAPLEYLNPLHIEQMSSRLGAAGRPDYWRALWALRTSPNGVFGHKLFQPYYVMAAREEPGFMPMLAADLTVHLYRRDKVAQAVSLARAQQTQAWASWGQENGPPGYDRDLIGRCLTSIARQEQWWATVFALVGAPSISIAYEDCVGREDEVAGQIRAALGLPERADCPPVRIQPLARQADQTSAEWIERFRAEVNQRLDAAGRRRDLSALARAIAPP